MKNLIMLLSFFVFLIACKDNPETKNAKESEKVETVTNKPETVKGYLGKSRQIKERTEELSKVTPLSDKEFKEWLPDQVGNMKRTSMKVGGMSAVNVASAKATYTSEDKSQSFKIEILDGAGESGSVTTSGMRMGLTRNYEIENDTEIERSVTRNGVKAIELYYKKRNHSEISFFFQDRFYLKASGLNMKIDELWDRIDEVTEKDLI